MVMAFRLGCTVVYTVVALIVLGVGVVLWNPWVMGAAAVLWLLGGFAAWLLQFGSGLVDDEMLAEYRYEELPFWILFVFGPVAYYYILIDCEDACLPVRHAWPNRRKWRAARTQVFDGLAID